MFYHFVKIITLSINLYSIFRSVITGTTLWRDRRGRGWGGGRLEIKSNSNNNVIIKKNPFLRSFVR